MAIPWLITLRLYGADRASAEAAARRVAALTGHQVVRIQSQASAEIAAEEEAARQRDRDRDEQEEWR